MAWGIYVAVKALINLNERFIESVSNPAGVIGLFFGLLIAIALIIRIIIYRGFRKKATDLAKKEQAFDETVSSEVACKLYQEKQQLAVQWTEFHNARNKASRALQRIVDSAYKFKVKTLLSGTTVNNWQSKYDQLRAAALELVDPPGCRNSISSLSIPSTSRGGPVPSFCSL